MRVAFHTLGCKVNKYETISMTEQFMSAGYKLVEDKDEADIYVLNSCTVTAGSDRKTRQILRRFRRQNKDAIIALCGCFPQAFPKGAEMLPEADVILGSSGKTQLLAAVEKRLADGHRIVDISSYSKDEEFEKASVSSFGPRTRAFIKIQDGCERFCAYCIIPFARGPVRSKSLDDLKKEVENLAENGYKEVVLVGINLSCYGIDFKAHLADAVETACSVEGIQRVRLGSLEPELLDDKVISRLAAQPKLCPQFHLSLQSGSDGTLKRMRRHYTTDDYRNIVLNLRKHFKNSAITTDIMVGFPGETDEEFKESMAFVRDIQIARAHVFAYSRRGGTIADRMEGQIDGHTKRERSKEMIAVTDQVQQQFLESQIGKTEPVLFEARNADGSWQGYTPNYTSVVVNHSEPLEGKIRNVRLVKVAGQECIGEVI